MVQTYNNKLIHTIGGVTMLNNKASSAKLFEQLNELKHVASADDRSQLDEECAKKELAWLSESLDK